MIRLVPSSTEPGHYSRLLEGMAHAVAAKGYAETTIADIVAEASVSRRTFYEHFGTKAECLIALYEAASHNALKVLREAIDPSHGWEEQVERALGAYLAGISGALTAPIRGLNPFMGVDMLGIAFVVVALGGLGNLPGAIVAGLMIGVAQSLVALVWTEASVAVIFAVMAVVLLVRPQGLFGIR